MQKQIKIAGRIFFMLPDDEKEFAELAFYFKLEVTEIIRSCLDNFSRNKLLPKSNWRSLTFFILKEYCFNPGLIHAHF